MFSEYFLQCLWAVTSLLAAITPDKRFLGVIYVLYWATEKAFVAFEAFQIYRESQWKKKEHIP